MDFMVANCVLRLYWHVAIKGNFQPLNRQSTSSDDNFVYSYLLSTCVLSSPDMCISWFYICHDVAHSFSVWHLIPHHLVKIKCQLVSVSEILKV